MFSALAHLQPVLLFTPYLTPMPRPLVPTWLV